MQSTYYRSIPVLTRSKAKSIPRPKIHTHLRTAPFSVHKVFLVHIRMIGNMRIPCNLTVGGSRYVCFGQRKLCCYTSLGGERVSDRNEEVEPHAIEERRMLGLRPAPMRAMRPSNITGLPEQCLQTIERRMTETHGDDVVVSNLLILNID